MAAERPIYKKAIEKGAEISQKFDKWFLVGGAGFWVIGTVGGITAATGLGVVLIGSTIVTYPIAEGVKRWAKSEK